MKKISLLSWILCILLTACNSSGMSPSPTSTPTPIPSSTATSTPNPPTEVPSPTIAPTPTEQQFIPLSEFENEIPSIDEVDYVPNPDFTQSWPATPEETKFASLGFYASGEWKTIQDPELREATIIRLLYRDNENEIQDVWMLLASSEFGALPDHKGLNTIEVKQDRITGKPEELLKALHRGAWFYVTIAWEKGAGDKVDVFDWIAPVGASNNFERVAYDGIERDAEKLELLRQQQGIDDPDYFFVPFSRSIHLPPELTP